MTRSHTDIGDTPQFDQFARRKNNNAIIDELRDAIESYEEDESIVSEGAERVKIISPQPRYNIEKNSKIVASKENQPIKVQQIVKEDDKLL